MNMKGAAPQPHEWTQRYETLRQHFLEQRQMLETDPLGLTLLLRNGLATWMQSWQCFMERAPEMPAPVCPVLRPPTDGWQHELTRLLAQITEQHLELAPSL
jgi:hypothetical protein